MVFVPLFLMVWVRSPYVKLSRIYCGCLLLRVDVQDKVGLFIAKLICIVSSGNSGMNIVWH